MSNNTKDRVMNLLENYTTFIRQVALLRYELKQFAEEIPTGIPELMALARRTNNVRSVENVLEDTNYVTLNYQGVAEHANAEMIYGLAVRLMSLEQKIAKLDYYISLIPQPERKTLRLYFFEHKSIQNVADELNISIWSVRKHRDNGIERLTEMYSFVENGMKA